MVVIFCSRLVKASLLLRGVVTVLKNWCLKSWLLWSKTQDTGSILIGNGGEINDTICWLTCSFCDKMVRVTAQVVGSTGQVRGHRKLCWKSVRRWWLQVQGVIDTGVRMTKLTKKNWEGETQKFRFDGRHNPQVVFQKRRAEKTEILSIASFKYEVMYYWGVFLLVLIL